MGTDSDILQVQGVNSKGFGIVPKMVMQDERLSIQAKAIYSYFCSYAGAGRTAFPQISKITRDLDISKNSYYKHFNQLKDYGYVKVEQEKVKGGHFSKNTYTLIESVPCTKICDTEKKHTPPCTNFRDTVKRDTKICDTNNNSIIKSTVFKNNSQSCQDKVAASQPDGQTDIDRYTKLIKQNIQYEDLQVTNHDDIALIDEIVLIMLDAIMSRSSIVRINCEDKPRELVRHQLVRITNENIRYVLGQFKSVTGRILNKRQYLLTMLYHSRMELEAHYTNLVNHDMGVK